MILRINQKESIMVIKHKKVSFVASEKTAFMGLGLINQILKSGSLRFRQKLFDSAHITT